jgi:hypothetical protein
VQQLPWRQPRDGAVLQRDSAPSARSFPIDYQYRAARSGTRGWNVQETRSLTPAFLRDGISLSFSSWISHVYHKGQKQECGERNSNVDYSNYMTCFQNAFSVTLNALTFIYWIISMILESQVHKATKHKDPPFLYLTSLNFHHIKKKSLNYSCTF